MNTKPNIDKVLSGYSPLRAVGRGGMATIYLYENRLTGELLAVKSMHQQSMADSLSLERFFHEVQASTRLDHRNIVKVFGYGEWNSQPAMVMEFVDGGDLKSLMDRLGNLPTEVTCYILIQIFRGLDYSHRLGIVHRDIKPSNILIDRNGTIKITDFGVSRVADLTRLTHTGDVLGTPAYMSPEQASGESVDERSDLFSAGVLLYEMLTNINPFISDNPSVTLLNIIRCNPTPVFERNPTIPFKLEGLIERIFEREPGNRIGSAAECSIILKEILKEIHEGEYTQDMFQQFLTSPEKYAESRRMNDSLAFCERGKSIYKEEKERPELAAIEFYRSLYLDPGNQEAKQFLTSITEKFSSTVSDENSKKTGELEEILRSSPTNVPILLQLIKRSRIEGNFIKAVFYSKRLVKLRPKDPYIISQIETLLPKDQQTEIISTRDIRDTLIMQSDVSERVRVKPAKRSEALEPHLQVKRSDIRARRSVSTGWIVLIFLGTIIAGSVFIAKKFRSSSEKVIDVIPSIMEKMKSEPAVIPQSEPDRLLSTRQKELLERAQSYFKAGDKQKTLEMYLLFVEEFPEHSESSNIRLQISNLYYADGDIDQAVFQLDKLIGLEQTGVPTEIARFRKIKILIETGRADEARWECRSLEPHLKNLTSSTDQIQFLQIYANLCESEGQDIEAIRLLDRIINEYSDRSKISEIRVLKADILIRQGNLLDAQRELWIVRDQSRPDSLIYKITIEKLSKLGLESNSGE